MEKLIRFARLFLLIGLIFCAGSAAAGPGQIKMSVFNFSTVNLEASGLGTSVANMLVNFLKAEPGFAILDRKELEAFLALNDLQQDENPENIIHIGTRLGLNAVVTGSVEKKGPLILITCKVIQVEQKKVLASTQVRSLDAGLDKEMMQLAATIVSTLSGASLQTAEASSMKPPVNLQKRSGNLRVTLTWEDATGGAATGFEVFRALSEAGPFARIAQVSKPEYADERVERNTPYYYKVRAFNAGAQSGFSPIVIAESALTPNRPIILRTEKHIKSVQLTWSPAPIASGDPLKLAGYRLYRAKTESGPYREVGTISLRNLAAGPDAGSQADGLLKITYMDRGLPDGESFYYRLTAYNEKDLESDFSLPVQGGSVPAVSGARAQGGMIREIRLDWDRIDNPSVQGYGVYRSIAENEGFQRIKRIDTSAFDAGKRVQFTDREGLGDNIRYYYRITALEDPDRETSPSATLHAVTRGKPPTPAGLKAKSGSVKKVELEWAASSADDVEGYKIYLCGEKDGKTTILGRIEGRANCRFTAEAHGSEKLSDSATYSYRVTSYNKVDVESEPSEQVRATTKPRPAKPTGLKGEDLRVNEAPLRWLPNPEKDIAVYHVSRSAEGGEFSRIAGVQNGTAFTDKGLKEGKTYRYRIQAEDRDGLISDYSETISVKTKPKPGPPTGISGFFRDGRSGVTWTPGAERDIVHYTIYEKRFFGPEKITTVSGPGFTDAGLAAGNSKTYCVTATDKDGLESDFSQEVTVTGGK